MYVEQSMLLVGSFSSLSRPCVADTPSYSHECWSISVFQILLSPEVPKSFSVKRYSVKTIYGLLWWPLSFNQARAALVVETAAATSIQVNKRGKSNPNINATKRNAQVNHTAHSTLQAQNLLQQKINNNRSPCNSQQFC